MDIHLTAPRGIRTWLRLRRLYLSSFPRQERKPFAVIARMHRTGKNDIWCIRRGEELLGIATTVKGQDTILLDYLAVEPRCRGCGVGSAAMEELKNRYRGKGLFVEVESVFDPGEDLENRQRRKDFYLRCGLAPMGVLAEVFGVNMELLGWECKMDFEGYRAFYSAYNSPWAAEHVLSLSYPEDAG